MFYIIFLFLLLFIWGYIRRRKKFNKEQVSKKFFLKPLGDKKNKLEVEKLFKNFSLQKKLLSNPLNIESNVDVMFYYWDGVKFPVEEIPQRISEVEFLHDNYFDVIV